jgi:hypothetical protein
VRGVLKASLLSLLLLTDATGGLAASDNLAIQQY